MPRGRENALRRLGIVGPGHGAWHMSRTGSVQSALSNQILRRYGFFQILRLPSNAAEFNRRMQKTARPVVWEGDRACPWSHDLIQNTS